MKRALPLLPLAAIINCTATSPMAAAPTQRLPQLPVDSSPRLEADVASGQRPTDFWFSASPVQGGLVIGQAPRGALTLNVDGRDLPLTSDGFFLIGFDRDASTSATLTTTFADGTKTERLLAVAPGAWRIEHVAANPTGGAKTSAEFAARRGAELARINAARALANDSNGWRQDFIRPVSGRISGLFGAQRIYNGTPGSYHSGMDIAAPTGTIFVAPADGVVTLAAAEPFTLEGHLLLIDHGMGLNSAFLHSSELLVREGETVRQGQPIGKVGATGRASGPHLHWGMKWNNARIEPMRLFPNLPAAS
jgi:hypothetical protein